MSKLSRRQFLTTAAISALVAVAACATTPVSQQNSSTPTKKPTRIVALEWVYVEDLLALGIQPVGVADIGGYQEFVNVEPKLADNVVDVGTRQEPNLEAIAKLEPDLILGVEFRHRSIFQPLSAIAPTLLYPQPEGENQLATVTQTFEAIATAVNRQDAAATVLQQMQQTFQSAAVQLNAINLPNDSFVLAHFVPGTPQPRLFTNQALAVQILTQIGLKNAWAGGTNQYGFNTIGLEELVTVQSANFLYIAAADDPQWQKWQRSPVWQELEFVKQNRLYSIGADTWVFGGPLSAQILVQRVIASLNKN